MKKITTFIIGSFITTFVFAQTISPDTEEITRRVADYVLRNTSFKFINKETGESWNSTKNIGYSPLVRVKSLYNEWYYVNGVLNIGMVQLGKLLNDKKYADYSLHNFDFIFSNLDYFKKQYDEKVEGSSWDQYFRLSKLDDCGAMAASLTDVYQLAKKKEYFDYLNKAIHYITTKQERLRDGTFVRPDPRKMTLWADDLYMSVPFLARMGKITGNMKYFDDAIRQVENFTKYLYDIHTGLYYHCWYSDVNMNGVAHWGRCNGWLMMAQTELLNNLPANHPKRQSLINLLLRQIIGLSRYQDTSGLWHQILDKPDSYLESSSTAMFVYSISKAVNQGWIDKSYLSVAFNGWKGLITRIQPDGQVRDICVGTGIEDNIKFYYERPTELNDVHGLGAVILAGIEIMNSERKSK